jgi:hypothetical protein
LEEKVEVRAQAGRWELLLCHKKISATMAQRLKSTAFTRFLIMLLIVGPLAYIGASYYNGQDPIENIRRIFNRESPTVATEPAADSSSDSADLLRAQLADCQKENALLNRRIGELEAQLKTLNPK